MIEQRPQATAETARELRAVLLVVALVLTAAPVLADPPPAPAHLRGAALSDERIRLRWQDNSCDETAQHLQVEVGGQWREVPYSLSPDTSAVILAGLQAETTYRVRVSARNADGESEPSEPTSVTTFAPQPECMVSENRLCLLGGRYAVTVDYEPSHDAGHYRAARAVPDGDRTGAFWFFDPDNLEVSVELTDGSLENGHVWVTAGGLSDLGYRLTVTDMLTGEGRTYTNPTHTLCGLDDRFAFPGSVSSAFSALRFPGPSAPLPKIETAEKFRPGWQPAAVCTVDPSALALHGGRFELHMDWRDDEGRVRTASARFDSDSSGFFVVGRSDLADWAVKILDGRAFNQHFWLFTAPLSGLEGWLRVLDTWTGEQRRVYTNPGALCGGADVAAFRVSPDAAAP